MRVRKRKYWQRDMKTAQSIKQKAFMYICNNIFIDAMSGAHNYKVLIVEFPSYNVPTSIPSVVYPFSYKNPQFLSTSPLDIHRELPIWQTLLSFVISFFKHDSLKCCYWKGIMHIFLFPFSSQFLSRVIMSNYHLHNSYIFVLILTPLCGKVPIMNKKAKYLKYS